MNSVSVLGAPASRRPVPSASIINSPARRQRSQGSDYERIEKAIVYLQAHFEEQPELATIARAVNLSEYHFQRLFSRWAGISPKRFLQFLTVEHAKNRLADASSVLDAALDAGLSGPGRLHDLFISTEAVTPGEFKARGAGIQISYGFHSTPFGVCLAGVTSRGLCWLSFLAQGEEGRALRDMKAHWGGAAIAHSRDTSGAVVRQVFSNLGNGTERRLNLLLMGTNFQVKVWQALLKIPTGTVTTYEAISHAIDAPGATRAVGSAIGANSIAYLIPCHRVIRKSGIIGGYRWGAPRKQALLAWEAARTS